MGDRERGDAEYLGGGDELKAIRFLAVVALVAAAAFSFPAGGHGAAGRKKAVRHKAGPLARFEGWSVVNGVLTAPKPRFVDPAEFFQTGAISMYNSSPQTFASGTKVPLQTDVNGNLLVNVISGGATSTTGNVASGSADSGNPVKIGLVYHSSAPTFVDGNRTDGQADSHGNAQINLATQIAGEDLTSNVLGVVQKPVASTSYSCSVDAQTGVVSATSKSGAGNLFSAVGFNSSATGAWLQVWDGLTVGTGAFITEVWVAAISGSVPGTARIGLNEFGSNGYVFSTGCSWGYSSTPIAYAAIGSGTGFTTQVYKK